MFKHRLGLIVLMAWIAVMDQIWPIQNPVLGIVVQILVLNLLITACFADHFEPRDAWIGVYVSESKIYLLFVPFYPIVLIRHKESSYADRPNRKIHD